MQVSEMVGLQEDDYCRLDACGAVRFGKVHLVFPLAPRPLLCLLKSAHADALARGPECNIVISALQLRWAIGTAYLAYVIGIDQLTEQFDVYNCNDTKRMRARGEGSGRAPGPAA